MRFAVPALLFSLVLCRPALHAQITSRFAAYEHCKFADDLTLVEDTSLAPGVLGRTIKTVMGPKQVPLAGGKTLIFGYPQTDPFATVKVEQIPAEDYGRARQDLIANFEQILTGDDTSTRNYALKPRLNGLEIYGLDRKTLEGGVLGMYLFFAERTHTATTVYFLNQDPAMRSFQSLADYAGLRDTFLGAYTGCVAGLPRGRTAEAHAIPSPPITPGTPVPSAEIAPAAGLPDAPSAHTFAGPVPAPAEAAPASAPATARVGVATAHKAAATPPHKGVKTAARPAHEASKPTKQASLRRPARARKPPARR